jgi:predicted nucleic acid-binding protein
MRSTTFRPPPCLPAPFVLVSNNQREFGRIAGLRTENWTI